MSTSSKRQNTRLWQQLILPLSLVLLLSGCASFEGKFSKTSEADIGIFADQTVAMLKDSSMGVSKNKAVYVREFFNETGAEEQKFFELSNKVHDAFSGLVRYSLRIVAISEGYPTDAEKVAAYADYAESVMDRGQRNIAYLQSMGEDIDITREQHTELIAKIRKQEKLLDAIRTAQPLISAGGRYLQILLDKLEAQTNVLADKIDAAIDTEYADIIRYQSTLHAEKYALLGGVESLYLSSIGDEAAYEKLKQSGVVRNQALLPASIPDYEQSKEIGKYFLDQFKRIGFIENEIRPDWETYRASHRELDQLHAQASANLNRSRVLLLVWLRAHEKMASGKTNPAAWFDLSETPSTLFQLGKKAIL